MSEDITLTIDGKQIHARAGQSILDAAEENGIYIPHLCAFQELHPTGACRVCMVKVNGRPSASCTQPVSKDAEVEVSSEELQNMRRMIVEMLFAEGNHFCPCCEKSGDCELQALAYRLGIASVRFPYQFPQRDIDAEHPEVFIDHNRCILCGRCVEASRTHDRKTALEFIGRGKNKKLAVTGLVDLDSADKAAAVCPVGAILRKRTAFTIPVGQRRFDKKPIGTEMETKSPEVTSS